MLTNKGRILLRKAIDKETRIEITTESVRIVALIKFEDAPRNGNDMVNMLVKDAHKRLIEREEKRIELLLEKAERRRSISEFFEELIRGYEETRHTGR